MLPGLSKQLAALVARFDGQMERIAVRHVGAGEAARAAKRAEEAMLHLVRSHARALHQIAGDRNPERRRQRILAAGRELAAAAEQSIGAEREHVERAGGRFHRRYAAFGGVDYRTRVRAQVAAINRAARDEMAAAAAEGRKADVLGVTRAQAYRLRRIAVSEANNARVERALSDLYDGGVRYVMWAPTSSSPCKVCIELSGRDNGWGPGVYHIDRLPPPPHPHCRCRRLPVIDIEHDVARGSAAPVPDDIEEQNRILLASGRTPEAIAFLRKTNSPARMKKVVEGAMHFLETEAAAAAAGVGTTAPVVAAPTAPTLSPRGAQYPVIYSAGHGGSTATAPDRVKEVVRDAYNAVEASTGRPLNLTDWELNSREVREGVAATYTARDKKVRVTEKWTKELNRFAEGERDTHAVYARHIAVHETLHAASPVRKDDEYAVEHGRWIEEGLVETKARDLMASYRGLSRRDYEESVRKLLPYQREVATARTLERLGATEAVWNGSTANDRQRIAVEHARKAMLAHLATIKKVPAKLKKALLVLQDDGSVWQMLVISTGDGLDRRTVAEMFLDATTPAELQTAYDEVFF